MAVDDIHFVPKVVSEDSVEDFKTLLAMFSVGNISVEDDVDTLAANLGRRDFDI
jgi:hypothetical protein